MSVDQGFNWQAGKHSGKSLLISLGIPVPSDSEESDDESSDSDDCVPDSDVSHGGDQALYPLY